MDRFQVGMEVRCLPCGATEDITPGKWYVITGIEREGLTINLRDDSGCHRRRPASHFTRADLPSLQAFIDAYELGLKRPFFDPRFESEELYETYKQGRADARMRRDLMALVGGTNAKTTS